MNKLTMRILTASVAAALCFAAAAPQGYDKAEAAFKAAYEKEMVDGDLKNAIAQYEKLARGSNRAVAAKALVRIGQCHEKLGSSEARKAYERVVRDFADQKEAVAEARRWLGGKSRTISSVVARRIERPAGVQEWVHEISGDGRFLVCSSGKAGRGGTLYLRDIETGETRTIQGVSPVMRHPLRLSPDGSRIAFISLTGPGGPPSELHVVRIEGSGLKAFTAKDLGGRPLMPALYGWSPDGQSLLLKVSSEGQKGKVILVRVSDGAVTDLGTAAGISGSIGQARISPDGRFIAYTKSGGPGYMGKGIAVRTLDGSRDVSLSPDGLHPIWTPDGKRVLFTSNRRGPTDLWAIPVANGEPTGPAEMIREGLDNKWPLNITSDGELFYSTTIEMRDLYTLEFEPRTSRPASKAARLTQRGVNSGSAWSPDGELLAYASLRDGMEPGAGEPASLVVRDMATGNEQVVVPKVLLDMNLSNPQWFPDNRSLLIQPQWGQQSGKLAKVDIVTGDVEMMPPAKFLKATGTWYESGASLSPDGRVAYYATAGERPGLVRIIRRELPGGEEKELRTVNTSQGVHISVSPDGKRLAFWVEGALMTMPASGGEPVAVSTGNVVRWGAFNAWSPDGKRIFFVGMAKPGEPVRNQECDIFSVPAEGGEPVPLRIGLHTLWFFHIHPDGKRLVFYDEYYPEPEVWSLKNLPGTGRASR